MQKLLTNTVTIEWNEKIKKLLKVGKKYLNITNLAYILKLCVEGSSFLSAQTQKKIFAGVNVT